MRKLPQFDKVADIRFGQDPNLDAWIYNFMVENNIEYMLNPGLIASTEQLRFMVYVEDDQLYVPCDDATFKMILAGDCQRGLQEQYNRAWRIVMRILRSATSLDPHVKRRIRQYSRHRFLQAIKQQISLPSRVVKRLTSIILSQAGEQDPWIQAKIDANEKARKFLQDPVTKALIRRLPDNYMQKRDTALIRWDVDVIDLARRIHSASFGRCWVAKNPTPEELEQEYTKAIDMRDSLRELFAPEFEPRKKILYLADADGGALFDLSIIRRLLRMGHQVIYAIKDGFYFHAPTTTDVEHDPLLKNQLEGAFAIENNSISKNELLHLLREHRFVMISDGTRERLNLYRTSVTFARAWKECDLVMAKGYRAKETFLGTSQTFTRDIFCFWEEKGECCYETKLRNEKVIKFTEQDLIAQANIIISQMEAAKAEGKNIMFYSCVIGSIPGQTKTAIELVTAFVKHMREQMEATFIINPAEHFIEGMDGDDLMYMWERVQRSGLIDVWRFQTSDDIEKSFALLGKKVPSVWAGKDSTFSTGCTKEMHIALDVQRKCPELQLTGPSSDKFFRRREYGVGKYFDAIISV